MRESKRAKPARSDRFAVAEGREPAVRAEKTDPADRTEKLDRADKAEKAERKLPMEPIEQAEPIEPIEQAEPTEPIDNTEPFEAIDNTESSDQRDHRQRFMKPVPIFSGPVPTSSPRHSLSKPGRFRFSSRRLLSSYSSRWTVSGENAGRQIETYRAPAGPGVE